MLKKALGGFYLLAYIATLFATTAFFAVKPTDADPEFIYYWVTKVYLWEESSGALCSHYTETTSATWSNPSHLEWHSTVVRAGLGGSHVHAPHNMGTDYQRVDIYMFRC